MCATAEAVEGSQLMNQLHIFLLNEVKSVNANLIAVIIMDTTCPSLHLDLLGELEYADEYWFDKDSNISACLCLLADATGMGHCQDSEENL